MREHDARRAFLAASGAGFLLAACGRAGQAQASPPATSPGAAAAAGKGEDVGAVEDLMGEHGVIRRVTAQHRRGREITEYVLSSARRSIGPQAAGPLARTLDAFARMYELHASIEDTIILPAWKKLFTPQHLDEIGDRFEGFEDIEHRTFGKDGFDDAVDQVGAIEKVLGIELAALTAPPPV